MGDDSHLICDNPDEKGIFLQKQKTKIMLEQATGVQATTFVGSLNLKAQNLFIFSTFVYECSKAHGHNRHMDLEAVLRRTNSHCGTSDLWIHVTSSQSILRIQNFKIGQRENFEEKKAPFLKYRDETIDKHFRVAIFTTNSGYIIYLGLHFVYLGIFVMKSGFRFSCWAPEMPFSRLSKRPFPLNPLFGQF